MPTKEKILVGLSGGVDSAVSAALLLEQGYEVVGGFMKNYISEKGTCTTYQDATEAIKVADHLGIPLLSFDLQQEYQEKIIDYIFEGYQKGVTPNPDVLCNSLIKFDVFLHRALEQGFDKIATGHYASIVPVPVTEATSFQLFRGKDHHKDQSYFLAGLNQFQLSKSLFPLGGLTKPEVRALAKKYGLPNADRKDSQGLCFIGNVPMREFLLQRLEKKEGAILFFSGEEAPEAGKKVGTHPGAYFYTIGQSHGLGLHFKAYVARIDVARNILYVTDKDHRTLTSQTLIAKNWHRINPEKKAAYQKGSPHHPTSSGKIRYRQNPPVPCTLEEGPEGTMKVTFDEAQRAIAPGQIFVAYQGELCLGCGTIV